MASGHETNPTPDVRRLRFTLQIGESRDFNLSGAAVLVFAESIMYGTSAGEIEIAIGETGDFFPLCPGDTFVLHYFSRFRLRNLSGAVRTGAFLYSVDPNFRVLNAPRGV